MLRGIRKASANWLGRIVMGVVMGVLAASFAVWGINDIFRNFGRGTLAKIGSVVIPLEQFRQIYNGPPPPVRPPARPPAPARSGEGDRPRPPSAARNDRRGRSRSARAANGARP